MKGISIPLKLHIAGPKTTLATCVRVTLKDGRIFGFTNHDRDLTVSSLVYEAKAGYDDTDIASNGELDTDNLEIVGLLVSPSITEDDLRAGVWDGAEIKMFVVNWVDLSQGIMYLRVGRLGQVTSDRQQFRAELLGLMWAYQTSFVENTSAGCRANFGDARCGVQLVGSPTYTVTGAVGAFNLDTLVLSDATRTETANTFARGSMTFNGGQNFGLTFEIKSSVPGSLTLQIPPPYVVAIGDTYTAIYGCAKTTVACKRYNNIKNFRGEPFLQGDDKLIQVGRRG